MLDPNKLELIQNRHLLDDVIIAPSYTLKDVWETQATGASNNFAQFMSLGLSNLLEFDLQDGKQLPEGLHTRLVQNLQKGYARSDWLITNENI